ncbi:hypothetical protein EB837_23040 [Kluyvera ascorbata]|uniref:Uncharacterized protein n=1 Tax=Kluyvera ascorbata TaxID=51288 RepID=A0A3N2RRA0_9ENTR|nr:hypothetical protein EB837_23040 [Kluyvera ascorbata]
MKKPFNRSLTDRHCAQVVGFFYFPECLPTPTAICYKSQGLTHFSRGMVHFLSVMTVTAPYH